MSPAVKLYGPAPFKWLIKICQSARFKSPSLLKSPFTMGLRGTKWKLSMMNEADWLRAQSPLNTKPSI